MRPIITEREKAWQVIADQLDAYILQKCTFYNQCSTETNYNSQTYLSCPLVSTLWPIPNQPLCLFPIVLQSFHCSVKFGYGIWDETFAEFDFLPSQRPVSLARGEEYKVYGKWMSGIECYGMCSACSGCAVEV